MFTIVIVVCLIVTLYYYSTRNFKYWEQRGVKHDKPLPLFGNNLYNFMMLKSVPEINDYLYRKYHGEKVVGYYRAMYPELIIRDPEIVKRILLTDFVHFYPRGLNRHKDAVEPLMKNLFFADGDTWKLLRQRLTPTFTSGKLRAMFPLITERAEKLIVRAQAAAQSNKPIDARDLMACYTTDFIGACGFGLDADSLSDESSAFRKLGKKIFTPTPEVFVKAILKEVFPKLCKNLRFMARLEKDLYELVDQILKQRNNEPSGRNDFIDLLLECQKKGKVVGESIENRKADGTPEPAELEFNFEIIAAQVFVFFAAGFETSSSATSYTLHQIAFNPREQEKILKNIDEVLEKHDGKLTYDAVKEMKYLECAFKEGMRLFPSLGFLIRECVHNYTIPEVGVQITPGVRVFIPVQSLHTDAQYFDSPNEFRPERFLPENVDINNKYVYLPFGDGPRACIGERLGMMQSIAGLAALLSKFTVEPAENTPRKPVVDPKSGIIQSVLGGIPLLFKERKKNI